jgi:hypothetical protein
MATCPHCEAQIKPVRDCSATPRGSGSGIAGGTWVCPECDVILGVSEIGIY